MPFRLINYKQPYTADTPLDSIFLASPFLGSSVQALISITQNVGSFIAHSTEITDAPAVKEKSRRKSKNTS